MGTLRSQAGRSPTRTKTLVARPSTAPHRFQAIVIEQLSPVIDGGEYPVKRVVDDELVVEADAFKDGHDLLAVAVVHRGPIDEERWRETPMKLKQKGLDRWTASIRLDRMGCWAYTIEAWVDVYATWRDAATKKIDAGASGETEAVEGDRIVREALARCRPGAVAWGKDFDADDASARKQVEDIVAQALRAPDGKAAVALLKDDVVAQLVSRWQERHLRSRCSREYQVWVDRPQARFAAWYEMFPRSEGSARGRSGTLNDAAKRLPAIADMGFDVVYLPPIHPIGRRFRKGKNNALEARPSDPGSPWAIGASEGGHKSIDPGLGTLRDFDRFVETARQNGLEVALDFAIQCSPDHPYVTEHPEWFFHRPDGTIQYAENPPKKYQDIYPLNFWGPHREALWEELRSIVYFWIEYGVRAFRVDNPHTKPLAFWRWLIDSVQTDHPDVQFLAEAFTRPSPMKALAKAGFTESYTYFTWRTSKEEITEYVTELTATKMREYYRANFWPNTPDILHEFLQKGGRPAFQIRLVLAATLSSLYGIYSGYELCENEPVKEGSEEYKDSEKYQFKQRDWDSPDSLAPYITKVNQARRAHPALQLYANVTFHEAEGDQILVYSKRAPSGDEDDVVIVALNLDPDEAHHAWVTLDLAALGLEADEPFEVEDLFTGERWPWRGARNWVRLDPAVQPAHLFVVHRNVPAT
jgi:starch synthase (maltosyl-transferring)